MANPLSPLNGQNQSMDYLVTDAGVAKLRRGVGSYAPTGAADGSADTSVRTSPATTSTRTSVAGAASDTLLLAANVDRKGATITNDSSAMLYVALGTAAATTSDYTVTLVGSSGAPFAYYEVPFAWADEIRGIWASATGHARITELT